MPNLPPDPEGLNAQRADIAGEVLQEFARSPHGEDYETETEEQRRDLDAQNLSDLLTDFAHLCDRRGLDLCDLLRRAQSHYAEETASQGAQSFYAA